MRGYAAAQHQDQTGWKEQAEGPCWKQLNIVFKNSLQRNETINAWTWADSSSFRQTCLGRNVLY